MNGTSMFDSLKRSLRSKSLPQGPQRVLVVDDEEPVRRFVARVLQGGGYETLVAEDGPAAIAIAEKEGPLAILVTDLMMPQMNGDELAGRMRQMQPGLKILYLTGYSDKLFKDKVTLTAGEAYLDKPCGVKGILEAVSLLTIGRINAPVVG